MTARFQEALNQIRAATLPCEYVIPAGKIDTLDFQKVNLHFMGPTREEDVPYVGRAERCDATRGGLILRRGSHGRSAHAHRRLPGHLRPVQGRDRQVPGVARYGCRTRTIDRASSTS